MSRKFAITRGTRQGDPISPTLFNSVLEDMMKDLQQSWQKRGFGIGVYLIASRIPPGHVEGGVGKLGRC